jgi:hypothetical protein
LTTENKTNVTSVRYQVNDSLVKSFVQEEKPELGLTIVLEFVENLNSDEFSVKKRIEY